jgi:hypothetical protein
VLIVVTDVSGHLVGPIFKGQAYHSRFLDCLVLEDGTDTVFRNGGNTLPLYAAQHPRRAKTQDYSHRTCSVFLLLSAREHDFSVVRFQLVLVIVWLVFRNCSNPLLRSSYCEVCPNGLLYVRLTAVWPVPFGRCDRAVLVRQLLRHLSMAGLYACCFRRSAANVSKCSCVSGLVHLPSDCWGFDVIKCFTSRILHLGITCGSFLFCTYGGVSS